ncbi:MAG: phage minor head protein [Rikenellaceae bacterium]
MELANDDTPSSVEVEKAFDVAAKYIHSKESFSSEMLVDEPIANLIDKTVEYLSTGIKKGVEEHEPSELMVTKLEENVGVFSGFKTFHEMKEASNLLLDEKGNIKPFERYANEVRTLNNTYNKNYLRAEYHFTVASSEMAARWEELEDDDDGRYLLQYCTAEDDKVRASHAKLNGVTLPPSDPFWDIFYPPNGWGCRCDVSKVLGYRNPATDSDEAMKNGLEATKGKYSEMFRFNSGKQKTVFPAHNSYTIAKCSTCSKNGLELAKIPSNELCAACPIIRECAEYSRVPTKRGVVRIHNSHGKSEAKENIKIASYFAEKYEHNIDLLPLKNKSKGSDAYNHTLKRAVEFKENVTNSVNSIDSAIRSASKQANDIVLWISSDITEVTLRNAVNGRVKRCSEIQSITIVRGGKDITYKRDSIIDNGFKINWSDLK